MEIKVRGKRIDNGELAKGGIYQDLAGGAFIISANRSSHSFNRDGSVLIMVEAIPVHPDSVGMWTGKKDKAFKDIYQGDIYECEDGPIIVSWNSHLCQFFLKSATEEHLGYSMLILDSLQYPYLGNTADNPELLENK